MRRILLATCIFSLCGCAEFNEFAHPSEPKTAAEILSGYNYVPLDPLPVSVEVDDSCAGEKLNGLWDFLPDNAVRVAVRQISGNASLGFGPAKVGYEGNTYQVVLDYINADVVPFRFRAVGGDINRGVRPASLARIENTGSPTTSNDFTIPVYVGIGLRLTANVTVHHGTVNLANLGALTAAADAQRVSGTLIVQTLGITGEKVTGALPFPSELNSTTIQSAMQALGSIKTMIYNPPPGTILYPRVTGIYNPLPNSNQETISLIVSELTRQRVTFIKTCPIQAPPLPSHSSSSKPERKPSKAPRRGRL